MLADLERERHGHGHRARPQLQVRVGSHPAGLPLHALVRTLLLVRHAPTPATRAAAFPADEPLDERARQAARRLAAALPRRTTVITSPARRCRETAQAAGLDAEPDERIAECDFGSWSGRSLAELDAEQPEAVQAWMLDPDAAPHGGESLAVFAARIAGWLDVQAEGNGRLAAVTHGEVIKAAVVHALSAPLTAFWRIDAAPLAVTELHAHGGRWTIARLNCSGP
jgi:broad specificity phosphatase PhoE